MRLACGGYARQNQRTRDEIHFSSKAMLRARCRGAARILPQGRTPEAKPETDAQTIDRKLQSSGRNLSNLNLSQGVTGSECRRAITRTLTTLRVARYARRSSIPLLYMYFSY